MPCYCRFLTTDCNNLIDNALLSIEFMQYSPACRAAACLQVGLASIFRDHSCGYLRYDKLSDSQKCKITSIHVVPYHGSVFDQIDGIINSLHIHGLLAP